MRGYNRQHEFLEGVALELQEDHRQQLRCFVKQPHVHIPQPPLSIHSLYLRIPINITINIASSQDTLKVKSNK